MEDGTGSGRQPGPRRRPTMQDVAREAGVSKGLVSMVLSGSSGPSAATQKRSWRSPRGWAIAATGLAALLARRRTRTLGVTLIPGNPFHGELAEEIQSAAEAAGYEVVLGSTAGARDEADAIETLVDSRCEVLLLLGATLPAATLRAHRRHGADSGPRPPRRPAGHQHGAVADDAGGIARAVEHLAGTRHRADCRPRRRRHRRHRRAPARGVPGGDPLAGARSAGPPRRPDGGRGSRRVSRPSGPTTT